MAKFRILSLDGGGSWALIQVMALIDMYGGSVTGHEVLQDFDLAAGNSGGSIVLGGLVENMTLSDLLGFFMSEQRRKSVFVEKLLHLPNMAKYETDEKLKGLLAALPQRGGWFLPQATSGILSNSTGQPIHLLIIGFDYDRNRSRFFRSAAASGAAWGGGDASQVRLAEAIHASTNAPVMFFDKPADFPSEPGRRYWDGAITGCNNPVLAAVTEAIVLG
ncbi:MAG TPA: patatin-like phospholipase family protein, partial [Terracidiphilus sp.]|nr:patatin-like phospholipase family protein [Terracidiphilus sp.]